ncbi:MAG: hypothetical protein N3E50_01695, partial [Candidatus Goldbacteria bacterium]|nr:hypothetical protein [Candidatus Goldiibacteriota bacterium]
MKKFLLFLFLFIPFLCFSIVYDLGNIVISESDYIIGISDFGKSVVSFSGKMIELNSSNNVVDILDDVPG